MTTQPSSRGPVIAGLVLASAGLMAFLGRWEGDEEFVVYADKLAGGLPTVCRGLTKHITDTPIIVGQRWSAGKCQQEEERAVTKVQLRLLQCFTRTPPQSVFDMATSHAWNLGVGATCGSSAMKAWNRGEWELGCRRIYQSDDGRPVWSYVTRYNGGKAEKVFVRGLANRREAEYRLCKSGIRI